MEIKLKVMAMPIRMLWMNRYANIYQSVGFDGMYLIHANTAAFEKLVLQFLCNHATAELGNITKANDHCPQSGV